MQRFSRRGKTGKTFQETRSAVTAGRPVPCPDLLHVSGDLSALLSMLRGRLRGSRVGRRSPVAFNQQRRVLFRQDGAPHLDFSALRDPPLTSAYLAPLPFPLDPSVTME